MPPGTYKEIIQIWKQLVEYITFCCTSPTVLDISASQLLLQVGQSHGEPNQRKNNQESDQFVHDLLLIESQ